MPSGVGQALKLGAGRGHTHQPRPRRQKPRLQSLSEAAGPRPESGHVGTLDPPTAGQAWETGNHGLQGPKRLAGACSLPPPTAGALEPNARAHGVNSLPVSVSCFPKRGREWFSCYQHGFWALGNAAPLFRGRCTKRPLFASLPLSLALPGPPHPATHPTPLPGAPPTARAAPRDTGVTVAWP